MEMILKSFVFVLLLQGYAQTWEENKAWLNKRLGTYLETVELSVANETYGVAERAIQYATVDEEKIQLSTEEGAEVNIFWKNITKIPTGLANLTLDIHTKQGFIYQLGLSVEGELDRDVLVKKLYTVAQQQGAKVVVPTEDMDLIDLLEEEEKEDKID